MPGRPHLTDLRDRPAGVVAGLTVALTLLLAGCSDPAVDVTPVPDPPATCVDVLDALPDQLDGHDARSVTAAAKSSARAWGDPTIVVRCGVAKPVGYDPTGDCVVIDDVEWFVESAVGGTIFTVVGGDPRVEVSVPTQYSPPSDVLVDVGRAISGHVAHPTCTG